MENNLRLAILLVAVVLVLIILTIFKRGRMPLKFALLWLLPVIVILLIIIIPDFLISITHLMGFQTLSNMIIGVLFILLFFICMSLTVIVSGQRTKINLLIQEVSMLKRKVEIGGEKNEK